MLNNSRSSDFPDLPIVFGEAANNLETSLQAPERIDYLGWNGLKELDNCRLFHGRLDGFPGGSTVLSFFASGSGFEGGLTICSSARPRGSCPCFSG
jgi:hypothetical protein